MDDEYRELDFSRHTPSSIDALIPEDIVHNPDYARKILRLTNITLEKFDPFLKTLRKLKKRRAIKKIIYSYDESLQEMPTSVDEIMHAISSKKKL